ncbi:hypothetical protein [Vibrio alginolyticus]
MPTTEKTLNPEDGYVAISAGEDSGSLLHIVGGHVLLHQSSQKPAKDAVHMGNVSSQNPSFVYFGLGSEILYAKAVSTKTKISVTPTNAG